MGTEWRIASVRSLFSGTLKHTHTQTPHTSHQPPPYSSNNAVTDSSLSPGSHWQGKGLIPNHFETWHDNDSNPSQGLKMAQHGFIVSQAGGAELLDLNRFGVELKLKFDFQIDFISFSWKDTLEFVCCHCYFVV